MSNQEVHFYFDFLSPYAYLAHHRLLSLSKSLTFSVRYHPVSLDWIKSKAGNKGLATRDMPMKLSYARADLQRWARRYGISLIPLISYASSKLGKGTFFADDLGMAEQFVRLAWQNVYGEGKKIDDDIVLSEIARSLGWDSSAFLEFVNSDKADWRLLASNTEAHSNGVFGVPTMRVGETIWWGNDRLDFLIEHLEDVTRNPSP